MRTRADATVSVERQATLNATNETTLRIDGKPEASAYAPRSTQILLAQLPLMAKPDSQDVFCFGMGSGITAGSVLGDLADRASDGGGELRAGPARREIV